MGGKAQAMIWVVASQDGEQRMSAGRDITTSVLRTERNTAD